MASHHLPDKIAGTTYKYFGNPILSAHIPSAASAFTFNFFLIPLGPLFTPKATLNICIALATNHAVCLKLRPYPFWLCLWLIYITELHPTLKYIEVKIANKLHMFEAAPKSSNKFQMTQSCNTVWNRLIA